MDRKLAGLGHAIEGKEHMICACMRVVPDLCRRASAGIWTVRDEGRNNAINVSMSGHARCSADLGFLLLDKGRRKAPANYNSVGVVVA